MKSALGREPRTAPRRPRRGPDATAGWLSAASALGARTTRWPRKVALVTIAVLVAALVGVSRVYLGAHEPTDVLGGWALGGLWVAAIITTTRVFAGRKRAAHHNPGAAR